MIGSKKSEIKIFTIFSIILFIAFLFSIMSFEVESQVDESWKPPEIIGKNPDSVKINDTQGYIVEWYEKSNDGIEICYDISVQNLNLTSTKDISPVMFINNLKVGREDSNLNGITNERLRVWDNFTIYSEINNKYDCSYLDNSSLLVPKTCDNFTQKESGSKLEWKETNRLTKNFTGNALKNSYPNINIPKLDSKEKDGTSNGTKIFEYCFSVPYRSRGTIGFEIDGEEYHPDFESNATTTREYPLEIKSNMGDIASSPLIQINLSDIGIFCSGDNGPIPDTSSSSTKCGEMQIVMSNNANTSQKKVPWNWVNNSDLDLSDRRIEINLRDANLTAFEVNDSTFYIYSNGTDMVSSNVTLMPLLEDFEDGTCARWIDSTGTPITPTQCALNQTVVNNGTYSSNMQVAVASISTNQTETAVDNSGSWFIEYYINRVLDSNTINPSVGQFPAVWDQGKLACVADFVSASLTNTLNDTSGIGNGAGDWVAVGGPEPEIGVWTKIKCNIHSTTTSGKFDLRKNNTVTGGVNTFAHGGNTGGSPNAINFFNLRHFGANDSKELFDDIRASQTDFNTYDDISVKSLGEQNFTVNTAPTSLTLSLPLNDTFFSLFPILSSSNSTDADNDVIYYYVEIDKDINFGSPDFYFPDKQETENTTNITAFNLLNITSDVVLYMPFEQNTTYPARDYSSNNNSGFLGTGTTEPFWNETAGYLGSGAYQFDGVDDYINLSEPSTLSFTGSGVFTISFWVDYNNDSGGGGGAISKAGSPFEYSIIAQPTSGGNLLFNTWTSGGGAGPYNAIDGGNTPHSKEGWHYFVITADGTNARGYVDGSQKWIVTNNAQVMSDTSANFLIGVAGSPLSNYFNGTIDEIRIYNRALSSDEIKRSYALGQIAIDDGKYFWRVLATDDLLNSTTSETREFTLDTFPQFTLIPNIVLDEDFNDNETNLSDFFSSSVYEDTLLNYSLINLNGTSIVTLDLNGDDLLNLSGNLTASSIANVSGSETYNITVIDGSGNQNLTEITFVINAVNDQPLFNDISNFSINEDDQLAELNISLNISDIDDPLTDLNYTITENNSLFSILAVENGTGNFTYQPSGNLTGTTTINITVIDNNGTGLIESDTFDITINAVNDKPFFNLIENISVNEDFNNFDLNLSDNVSDVEDIDANLVFDFTSNNSGIVTILVDNSTGNMSFVPVANQSGDTTINLTVIDTGGLTESTEFTLTINAINDIPSIPILHLPLNATTLSTNLTFEWNNISDVEGDQINYTIEISDNITFSYTNYSNSTIFETTNVTIDVVESLNDSEYYWRVIAFDGTDNSSDFSEVRTVTVDNTPSLVNLIQPENKTYFSSLLNLEISSSGDENTIWYNIDNGANITITENISFTNSLGDHILFAFTNDSLGNENGTSVSYNIGGVTVIDTGTGGGSGNTAETQEPQISIDTLQSIVPDEQRRNELMDKYPFLKIFFDLIKNPLTAISIALSIFLLILSMPKNNKGRWSNSVFFIIPILALGFYSEKIISFIEPYKAQFNDIKFLVNTSSNSLLITATIVLFLISLYILYNKRIRKPKKILL